MDDFLLTASHEFEMKRNFIVHVSAEVGYIEGFFDISHGGRFDLTVQLRLAYCLKNYE